MVGEGAEWKSALTPTAPYELNNALPLLIIGQIQKILNTFYPNKKGVFGPKNHLTLLSLLMDYPNVLCRYNLVSLNQFFLQ
jgi:hypothetical protein